VILNAPANGRVVAGLRLVGQVEHPLFAAPPDRHHLRPIEEVGDHPHRDLADEAAFDQVDPAYVHPLEREEVADPEVAVLAGVDLDFGHRRPSSLRRISAMR
jgi:hypothetical protein